MTMRFATDDEVTIWNDLVVANPDGGNVFQGAEFAAQKELGNWTTRHIVNDDIAVTVLEKHIFGLGAFWYIPKGPGITSVEALKKFASEIRVLARKNEAFAIKIEPEIHKDKSTAWEIVKLELAPSTPVQPNFSTVLVDISENLDDVLAHLNQKGRHAIKRAQRDGVTTERVDATEANCEKFYELLKDTAEGSFVIRPYEYYRAFWQRYADGGKGQLFFAYYEGAVVAGAYALIFGEKSTYKDGASIRKRTAYGASHLLQWGVITWAKERGSIIHDLCGAPPSDCINDEQHPHYGIGRFKTSFNKEVTDYVGAYDIIISPMKYKIWQTIGEKVIKRLWWRKHHESWY